MTAKAKKAKPRRGRPGRVIELLASVEDAMLSLAGEKTVSESRWNRPRKRRISLRVDAELVHWFKSPRLGLPHANESDFEKSDARG